MEGLTEKQYSELVETFGRDAAKQIEAKMTAVKGEFTAIAEAAVKGKYATQEEAKQAADLALVDVKKMLQELQDRQLEQGKDITSVKEAQQGAPADARKSLEEVLKEKSAAIKALYAQGAGNIEIPLSQVDLGGGVRGKTAGITSIGNSIQPMSAPPNSPWLPGVGGPGLELFEIIYNPNFITNFIDRGRTTLSMLPWANQTTTEGAAAFVQEGAPKPLWNTRFKVEFSTNKKIAAMTTITEEFDQDLPGFTTLVKRLLMDEVMRKFDDAIYAAVIAIAGAQTVNSGLNGQIDDANLWDAIGVGLATVSVNNYVANFIGLNPITMWKVWMTKTAVERQYLQPPFLSQIQGKLAESNKVAANYALIGDMNQYKVDIYKEPVLKVGWNNDDFQRNQFSVVAELRYHDYISDIRKNAFVYYNLNTVLAQIDSGS